MQQIGDELFDEHRGLLFGIAYRMLGSVMDAEDIVQESFLRWRRVDPATVESPRSYLTALVTRLCIDHLRSARVRRETYVGPWLPEPLVGESHEDVADTGERNESISMAFLVLMESLTPLERAVFLLHDVFDYQYAEIGRTVGRSEAYCRQIGHRAREYVRARRPRFDHSPDRPEGLAQVFLRACTTGDLSALLGVLTEDVALWSDGGGKVRAALRPIRGPQAVAKFIMGILAHAPPGLRAVVAQVNGQPGIVTYVGKQPNATLELDSRNGRIQGIRIVVNPDKLRHLT